MRTMVARITATAILILVASTGRAMDRTEAAHRFEEANAAFMERDYPAARDLYQEIIDAGYRNGYVYFNLGNAWFRLGNLGKAVLCYERATRLLPRNQDVQRNLKEAQSHREKELPKIEKHSSVRFFHTIRQKLSVNEWALVASVLFFATCISFTIRLFLRSQDIRVIVRNVGLLFIGLCIWAGTNAATRARWEARPMYVVIDSEVEIFPGLDQTDGPPDYTLGSGAILDVLRVQIRPSKVGNEDEIWLEVGYEGGPLGWCRGEGLEKI